MEEATTAKESEEKQGNGRNAKKRRSRKPWPKTANGDRGKDFSGPEPRW